MKLADTSYSNPTQDFLLKSTVVCVTNQRQCERLIKAGRIIANISKTSLTVISVMNPDQLSHHTDALQYLFDISKQNDAVMSIQYSADALATIADFIHKNKAINVVTGLRDGQNSILPRLWTRFSDTNFFTVTLDGEVQRTATKTDSIA